DLVEHASQYLTEREVRANPRPERREEQAKDCEPALAERVAQLACRSPSIVTVDDLQPGDQLPGEWVERAVLRIKRRIWEGPIHVELRGTASRAIQMAAAIGFTASALGPLPGESQQDVGRAGWSEDRPVGAKEPGDARRGDG